MPDDSIEHLVICIEKRKSVCESIYFYRKTENDQWYTGPPSILSWARFAPKSGGGV